MKKLMFAVIALVIIGCATAPRDPVSIASATNLKTDAVTVLEAIAKDTAHPPVANIQVLLSKLDGQLAYEKGKNAGHANFETVEQWRSLCDRAGISLGKFLQDVLDGKVENATHVRNVERIVGKIFDAIIEGEGAKIQ